jgi:hypothetical protein
MAMRLRKSVLLGIALMLIEPIGPSAAFSEQGGRSTRLEVTGFKYEPVCPGKNVFAVTVRNLTEKALEFTLDIRTQPASRGAGWQSQFSEILSPKEQKALRFGYTFNGIPQADGFVRVRFYDFVPSGDQGYKEFFKELRRSVAEIGLQGDQTPASVAAPSEVTGPVLGQFARFQDAVRDRRYIDAWQLLTRLHRQAGFQDRRDGSHGFAFWVNMEPSPAAWSRADISRLRPIEVHMKADTAVLRAKAGDALWTLDFALEGGEWRIDWIAGRPPMAFDRDERLSRLLPLLENRATPHFDIFYVGASTAAKHMDAIVRQREDGYRTISEFLGTQSEPHIRLIFFEDADSKWGWTFHNGAGLAYDTTIVEVYNDAVQLDPFHEVAHILANPLGTPPAVLDEGFAVHMSELLGSAPVKSFGGGDSSTYERARQLRQEGRWIPLAELLTYTEIGSTRSQPGVAYPEAGAFVKFLVDTYGKEKFLAAFKELRASDDASVRQQNVSALERICGKPLADLDRQWLTAMGLE